jgi:hypothetical protein
MTDSYSESIRSLEKEQEPTLGPSAPSAASLTSATPRQTRRPLRRFGVTVAALVAVVIAIWGANDWFVGRPVRTVLTRDSRNAGFSMRARWQYYVAPSTLVLDLTRADAVSAADLLRGTFWAAETLYHAGRHFDRVVLARRGTAVFLMNGEDFEALGTRVAVGENPVYLMRTFPERLRRPDGSAAFGTWTGGWLGVLGKQMEDVNEAAREWADGHRP